MAEFCECGSLVIDGRCTNKNCSLRGTAKPVPVRKSSAKKKVVSKSLDASKPSVKSPSSRRASKCITYNLSDIQEKETES